MPVPTLSNGVSIVGEIVSPSGVIAGAVGKLGALACKSPGFVSNLVSNVDGHKVDIPKSEKPSSIDTLFEETTGDGVDKSKEMT